MYVFVKSQVFRKCQSSPAWTHTILRQQIVDLERVKARGRVWERQALGCQLEREKVPLVTVADGGVLRGTKGLGKSQRGAPHDIPPVPDVGFAFLFPERSAEDAVNGERACKLGAGRRRNDSVRRRSLARPLWLLARFFVDAFSPPTKHSVRKGVLALWVQHPVVVLPPRSGGIPQHLEKAVVERQIVAHRVSPAGVGASKKRELFHEVVVDFGQSEAA